MRSKLRSWVWLLCLVWAVPVAAQQEGDTKNGQAEKKKEEKDLKKEKAADAKPAEEAAKKSDEAKKEEAAQPKKEGDQPAEDAAQAGKKPDEAKPEDAKPGETAETVAATAPGDEEEEVIFERLTGLYFEGRGGVFFTLGGARKYSNGQPMFGFELGYDVNENFSTQLAVTLGYQAANPLMYPEECSGDGCRDYHLDFAVTMFNLSADYDLFAGRRWAFEIRAGGGAALINPTAKPEQSSVDFDVFGGLRFEYYTLLRHFSLAAEYDFYFILPTNIPAMSVSVSLLYNF